MNKIFGTTSAIFGNVGNAINDFEEFNAHFPIRPRRQKQNAFKMAHRKQHVLFEIPLFARPRRFTARAFV